MEFAQFLMLMARRTKKYGEEDEEEDLREAFEGESS